MENYFLNPLHMAILNTWWYLLALPMDMFFNIWWMMFSINIWMISWFITLMTSSFFQEYMEEHEQHIWLVLNKLREVGLYATLEKCKFHQTKVALLGYIISRDGIRMWILVRSKPLWIRLPQLLFMMFNVLLDSPTFIGISLHNIPW